ncbi:MAG TPA: c-type cytochrome [Acidobacteriaceae bacterium]|jgi:mono/diheme cytochrome c family protein|nr:c-type cytochrome [Acidobacteriaceae bacterium]
MRTRSLVLGAVPLALALAGCGGVSGTVAEGPPPRPEQVVDFKTLYNQNCQACHGENGQNGPSMDLGNPEFQALVDDNTLRDIISHGLIGTQMPAWAEQAGGMLTDQQINAIIAGMRKEWAKPNAFSGATPPPLKQPEGGSAPHGQQIYQQRCAGCHQGNQRQQPNSPVYLSLVSDDVLRTIIIAGRPDIHQPDFQHDNANGAAGQPLSAQDVTDIVAYLHSLRNPDTVSAAPTPRPPRR